MAEPAGDVEGTKRVRDTLDFVLKPVLDGFVEANMKKRHGLRWLHYASRSAGQGRGRRPSAARRGTARRKAAAPAERPSARTGASAAGPAPQIRAASHMSPPAVASR